jgi:hypothetical protein
MSDDSTDVQKVTVRLYENDQNALAAVIADDSNEYGNKSDAIRGLLRNAATGEVAADGGPATGPTIHAPDDDAPRAVYEHALALVDDEHRLSGNRLGELAKAVNNDGETNLSPDADTIDSELRQLERAEYVRRTFAGSENGKGRTDWLIKPPQATPEAWLDAPSNVERFQQARAAWRAGDEERALELVDQYEIDLAAADTTGGEARAE